MPTFSYKALREDKTSYTGTMEAKDRFAVYAQIRKEGGEVVRVTQTKSHSLSFQGDILAPFRRVKEIEVALLTRNLSTMLRAGLPLSRALSVLERQSKNPKTKDTLKSIAHELEQGGSLSSGMKRHPRAFSPLVCAMVEAGEESGTLSETLATISTQLTANYELKKRVRGAMLYPSIILTVLIAVGILMMVLVVPALSVAFRDLGADLPFTTKLVLSLSDALRSHGFLVALLALMMGLSVFRAPKQEDLL
jgi:type IV pilus assembly protein PilC